MDFKVNRFSNNFDCTKFISEARGAQCIKGETGPLMKIKLNCQFQDLAYRFGVSVSTVSRIFDKWIDIMSTRLQFLILWPQREKLIKTIPLVFRQNFGDKVAVIIDCFEVFIERPSSLIARAMTWSNYKHHNTVKFLIGITPQGVISYISKA